MPFALDNNTDITVIVGAEIVHYLPKPELRKLTKYFPLVTGYESQKRHYDAGSGPWVLVYLESTCAPMSFVEPWQCLVPVPIRYRNEPLQALDKYKRAVGRRVKIVVRGE